MATQTDEVMERTTVDWLFAKSPFWIFSHIFAASVIALFVVLGFWQLDRLDARQTQNELVETRLSQPIELISAPDGGLNGSELDYRSATAVVDIVDEDFVRVGNRSQGGVAGEHVVAIVALADGSELAVNRGFVPANVEVSLEPLGAESLSEGADQLPNGSVELTGWLRATVERGSIGATDSGDGSVLPRFDTERLAFRLGRPLPSVWLQVSPSGERGLATFPDPVPLPPLDQGPHLSYAVQWFIFATLGTAFYAALLRRQARGDKRVRVVAQPLEP